jgi:hypothetical protein
MPMPFPYRLLPVECVEKPELAQNYEHNRLVMITLASRPGLVLAWARMCKYPAVILE